MPVVDGFWQPMRKSLGSKRRAIGDDARAEIVRIYRDFLNGESGEADVSRIFNTTDFGYREIRVERPLRLRLEITQDLLDELYTNEKSMITLTDSNKKFNGFTDILLSILTDKQGEVWKDSAAFIADMTDAMIECSINLPASTFKTLVSHFSGSDRKLKITKDLLNKLRVDEKSMMALTEAGKIFGGFTDMLLAMLANKRDEVWMDRAVFIVDMTDAMKKRRITLPASALKLLIGHFGKPHEGAKICRDKNGNAEPDARLRDHEIVPLEADWQIYVAREVTPFVPDAWVDIDYKDATDGKVGRVGYEVNFNRSFYQYVPLRPLEKIDAEMMALESEIAGLLKEVLE